MLFALMFFGTCGQPPTQNPPPVNDTSGGTNIGDTSLGPCQVGPNNKRPTVSIQLPPGDQCYRSNQQPALEAMVADDGGLDCLQISLESSVDGLLTPTATLDPSGLFAAPLTLSNNRHKVTLKVVDGDGRQTSASVGIEVNDGPTGSTVVIAPDPAHKGDELSAVMLTAATDPDGDAITYTFDWYVESLLFSSGYNGGVPPGTVVTDEVWEVVVTPYDNCGPGEAASDDITIE